MFDKPEFFYFHLHNICAQHVTFIILNLTCIMSKHITDLIVLQNI